MPSKDNILYIGPYREFSGMGNASRNYIRSLQHTGHNVSIRPIYNEHNIYPETALHGDIISLENNSSKKYHKIIQHCYPHQLVYDARFDQNIGIVHLETNSINTTIGDNLSVLDSIIVGSSFVKKTILNHTSFDKPIHIIPEPLDLELIKDYRENNEIEVLDYNYKFYTISSFIDRKNIQTLLLAFLILSNHYPDIDLIIKLRNISQTHSVQQLLDYEFEKIYTVMRNNFVKKPKILIGNISYDNVLYIHNNNDCYVSASYGESFGYSALEAVAFNNNIICTSHTGFDDLLNAAGGLSIASDTKYCVDKDRLFPIYNSVYEKWSEPKIDDLVTKMSLCINESKQNKKERIAKQNQIIENYTIPKIAELFSAL
jgi:glycosyltransferase involved in cell wall biosynthesis